MKFFGFREDAREVSHRFVLPILRFAALLNANRHFERTSSVYPLPTIAGAVKNLSWCRKVMVSNGQREWFVDFQFATQRHLTDRCTVLLAVAEQRLDQYADYLTDAIAVVPRSAGVDPTFTLRPLARLVVLLVGVLRMTRDVELAASADEVLGVEVLVRPDARALLSRQATPHVERSPMLGRSSGQGEPGIHRQTAAGGPSARGECGSESIPRYSTW